MRFTVKEIAALTGAVTEGDENAVIDGISRIEDGKPGTISFYANPKYEPFVYETRATAVLVPLDFSPKGPVQATLLRVSDPYTVFTSLLEMAMAAMQDKKGREEPCFIHPEAVVAEDCYIGAFAYVGAGAKVGPGAKIYPQAYVGDAAEVGEGSVLYSGVKVYHGCRVGRHCILHSGAVIGSDGFGFAPQEGGGMKKIPQTGIVVLEDHVEIGANTTVDRATLGETLIRSGAKLDNLVQIAHNVRIGAHTVIAAQSGISGSTHLGDGCMIGGQVGIVGHLRIADGTKVGAQSGLSKNVEEPGKALRGSPAMDYRRQLRAEAVFRNLEELARRVDSLEKQLSESKEQAE